MRLDQTRYDNTKTGCCARLDPDEWNGRELVWKDKPFLKDHVHAFLHIPLDFGQVMERDQAALERQEAFPEEPLWLSDETSLWGSELYMAADREVLGEDMVRMSGRFLTRLFQGSYRDVGKWAKEMRTFVKGRGLEVEHLYFHYATCPKCARKLGTQQVVIFAKVKERPAPVARA